MDFRRLTKRTIDDGPEDKGINTTKHEPGPKPYKRKGRPSTTRPAPEPEDKPKRQRPQTTKPVQQRPATFTVPKGGQLHFYKVHQDSGKTLAVLGIEDPQGVAEAVADLRGEEAWCLYLEAGGRTELVATSDAMAKLME